jgi:pimeloyl-ACP methyl ester carboxylesterase
MSSSPTLGLATRSVALPTGVTLQYVEQGSPAGIPVLMAHGFTDSLRSFELVLPHLPPSIRAFAVSQRGHGDSSRPESGYRVRDFAADLAAFLDTFGIERAVVVGHSMGSYVAQRFALDEPHRARGLVLLGAFSGFTHNSAVVEFAEVVDGLEDPIEPSFAAEFQRSTLAQPIPDAYFAAIVQESLKVPARVWKAAMHGLLDVDHRPELANIQAPTLIVWGDQDAFCPRSDQDILATIPRSELRVYAGAGHAMHWEEPARVAADLAAFIEKIA